MLETGLTYASGRPVRVRLRRRGHKADIDDLGGATVEVDLSDGWLEVARSSVEEDSLNVNRRGVVFVQAFAPELEPKLAPRVAEASRRLELALLGAA